MVGIGGGGSSCGDDGTLFLGEMVGRRTVETTAALGTVNVGWLCLTGDGPSSSLDEDSVEIVSRLFIMEPSRVFRARGFPFFAAAVTGSFLFGVVFGGASGCWCGVVGAGDLLTAAEIGCVTIFRGRPRAFFSLSIDLDLFGMNELEVRI